MSQSVVQHDILVSEKKYTEAIAQLLKSLATIEELFGPTLSEDEHSLQRIDAYLEISELSEKAGDLESELACAIKARRMLEAISKPDDQILAQRIRADNNI